jgi:hypothetical protein
MIPESTELDLSFHLIFKDHQTPPIPAIGRVRYNAEAEGGKRYRVGIEFITIKKEDRKAISDFVNIKTQPPQGTEQK